MSRDHWLITTPPPTPNGDLHLGHLSGPYLGGDILSRHLRRCGHTVGYVSGIDDHQSSTHLASLQGACSPEEVADRYAERIRRAWTKAEIVIDECWLPRASAQHRELAAAMFAKLYTQGHIVPRTTDLPYCANCQRWAYEAYVTGGCPHCGEPSCGNSCEACGLPNDNGDLKAPRCVVCDSACGLRSATRLYFPLEPWRRRLEEYVDQTSMSHHLQALAARLLSRPLPEIAVSHPSGWGLELPADGYDDQRMYVWFEMAAGYLSATRQFAGDREWADLWEAPSRVVQFFGFDNGYFHTLLIPAILFAYDAKLTGPSTLVCNEFYQLTGQKFSTSRDHAIWLLEVLDRVPASLLRLYVSWTRPSTRQTNFTWEEFDAFCREGPPARWREWLSALSERREHAVKLAGQLGDETGDELLTVRFGGRVQDLLSGVDTALSAEEFSPRRALLLLDQLADEACEFGAGLDTCGDVPMLERTYVEGVRAELGAAAGLAAGLYPIAPALAEELWAALKPESSLPRTPWHQVASMAVTVPLASGDIMTECPLLRAGEYGRHTG
ncbi:class I tRNA ligase family protein [Nonomuraea jabiensis]|uniref:class I tRNA ligase family protein n=1 Tax=Nonomuraea jabiensis TaxID=882448 RepID=UPI00343A4A6C